MKELLAAKVGDNLNVKISHNKVIDYNSLVRNQQIHTNINRYVNEIERALLYSRMQVHKCKRNDQIAKPKSNSSSH